MTPTDLPERLARRIVVLPNGCWLWTGCRDGLYGKARYFGHIWRMHRLTYTLLVDDIPACLTLDHLCREEICCNPLHVEPVTNEVNVRRGFANSQGAAAYWRAKTHCPRGHAYDEANTGLTKRGGRICRTCARDKMRAKRAAALGSEVAA